MRRLSFSVILAAAVCALVPATGYAQQQQSLNQSINLFLGSFSPQSFDSRNSNDVLVQDSLFLSTWDRSGEWQYDISRFGNVTVGGEWLFGLGRYLDGGLGVGFYDRTVPTVDTNYVDQNNNDIVANLKAAHRSVLRNRALASRSVAGRSNRMSAVVSTAYAVALQRKWTICRLWVPPVYSKLRPSEWHVQHRSADIRRQRRSGRTRHPRRRASSHRPIQPRLRSSVARRLGEPAERSRFCGLEDRPPGGMNYLLTLKVPF